MCADNGYGYRPYLYCYDTCNELTNEFAASARLIWFSHMFCLKKLQPVFCDLKSKFPFNLKQIIIISVLQKDLSVATNSIPVNSCLWKQAQQEVDNTSLLKDSSWFIYRHCTD
jgi:hypothetical protein